MSIELGYIGFIVRLKLNFLGQFQVTLDDLPLTEFRSNKTRALLAYLALEAQRPIAHRHLAAFFWEGYQSDTARASLRSALTNLRSLLSPLGLLRTSYRTVQFDVNNSQVWMDVRQLEDVIRRGHDPAELLSGKVVYNGEFLPGFEEIDSRVFQTWLMERRNRTGNIWKQVAESARNVAPPINRTAPDAAIANRPHETIAPKKANVVESATPTERGSGAEPYDNHNLPRRLTRLIGRGEEIHQLHELLLAGEYPLITILGEGGVGKSMLAIEVASHARAHFPDGIWRIDLSTLEEKQHELSPSYSHASPAKDHVADALYHVLATMLGDKIGLSFHNTDNLFEHLLARLRRARALLILDSYEYLPKESDLVWRLVQATDALKVLVTSRRPLNLMGEYRYYLHALPTPTKATTDAQELLRYASVELFVQRAQAIQPNFTWDHANASLVAQICRFVGGLPLGIELAAVQLRYHDCATILAKLEHDFSSVTTSMLDVPVRHRNMRTVLAASWQLLAAEEREVLAACTIFRDGFDVMAAEAVAHTTQRQLTTLVEHSLLRVNENRFEMHDLVRQFAVCHLRDVSQREIACRKAHAAYYIAFLQAHAPAMGNSREAVVLIQTELENIRAAWEWAITTLDLALLKQGWQGLFDFYRVVGFAQEGVVMAGRAVAALRAQPVSTDLQQELLAMMLVEQAHYTNKIGKLSEAETLAQQALEIGRVLNSPAVQARIYYELSCVTVRNGLAHVGIEFAERGRIHARAAGSVEHEVMSLTTLVLNLIMDGEYHAAVEYSRVALSRVERINNLRLHSKALTVLGLSLTFLGESKPANDYYTQALAIARQLDDKHTICQILAFSVIDRVHVGQYYQASQEAEEAVLLARAMGDHFVECVALTFWALAALRSQEISTALQVCGQGLEVALANQFHYLHLQLLVMKGYALLASEQHIAAEQTLRQALNHAQELKTPMWVGLARVGIANLFLVQNRLNAAYQEIKHVLAELPEFDHQLTVERSSFFYGCYHVLSACNAPEADAMLVKANEAEGNVVVT